jgi:YVTN family beta-propeller protein
VVVVEPLSGRLVTRIAVGKRPRGLGLSRDGRHLYVALSGSPIAGPDVDESKLPPPDRRADGIGVIDLRSRRLIATLPSGADPEAFAVSPDGKSIYVSNEDSARISAIDIASGRIRGNAAVGVEPEGIAISPDGRRIYVACEGNNLLYVIDAATLKVAAQLKMLARPRTAVLATVRAPM